MSAMDLTLGGGDVCGLHGFPCDGLHDEEDESNQNLRTDADVGRVQEAIQFLDGWDIDAAWVDAACAALREWVAVQEQTPTDLVAALIAEGGEITEAFQPQSTPGLVALRVPEPGRYLVFPIPVESAEAKETL